MADHATSPADWIWLREALALAATALGSEALAKERLREWLAAGGLLPWDCVAFNALNAERIAELERERQEPARVQIERRGLLEPYGGILPNSFMQTPATAYFKGDHRFWADSKLEIDWIDNSAREVILTARALRASVCRARLSALLSPPADAEVPVPSANAPAASPAPPKTVFKAVPRTTLGYQAARVELAFGELEKKKGFKLSNHTDDDLRRLLLQRIPKQAGLDDPSRQVLNRRIKLRREK